MNAKTTYMGDLQIRRAHRRVEPLEEGSTKYRDRIRVGKTRKDHESGAWNKRFVNRDKRQSYMNARGAGGPNPAVGWPAGQPVPNDK